MTPDKGFLSRSHVPGEDPCNLLPVKRGHEKRLCAGVHLGRPSSDRHHPADLFQDL